MVADKLSRNQWSHVQGLSNKTIFERTQESKTWLQISYLETSGAMSKIWQTKHHLKEYRKVKQCCR